MPLLNVLLYSLEWGYDFEPNRPANMDTRCTCRRIQKRINLKQNLEMYGAGSCANNRQRCGPSLCALLRQWRLDVLDMLDSSLIANWWNIWAVANRMGVTRINHRIKPPGKRMASTAAGRIPRRLRRAWPSYSRPVMSCNCSIIYPG